MQALESFYAASSGSSRRPRSALVVEKFPAYLRRLGASASLYGV
jgi:hypothetical protein